MEAGKVLEYDHPFLLLVNDPRDETFTKESEFSEMI